MLKRSTSPYILLKICFILIILSSLLRADKILSQNQSSGYTTDSWGNVLVNINIIGHIQNPGTYLINENNHFLTTLATAGGTLPGAKLDQILLYRENGKLVKIDLTNYLNKQKSIDIQFKPNDTIIIKQNFKSYLFSISPIVNVIVSLLNIFLITDKI